MSPKSLLIFVCVAILVAASTVEAQASLGNVVHVNGTLYCSSNGNASGSANTVFPNATVEARCTPGVVFDIPFNTTTNANGAYLVILIPLRNATVASITSNCRLFVLTPLSACSPALPSVGLVSNLSFVRTIQVGFMRLSYFLAAGFTIQS